MLGSVLNAAYRSHVVVPGSVTADQAHSAGDTLAGAVRVAGDLDPATADSLLESARTAFDLGMQRASLVGIVVAVGASVVSFVALRKATGK